MTLNENIIKGKWTDDELEKTKGDIKSIRGLLQKRYGKAEESYDKKLDEIVGRVEKKKTLKQ